MDMRGSIWTLSNVLSSKFFRLIGDNIVWTNICVLFVAIFVKCLRLIQNKFIQYFSLATVFTLAKQHDINFFLLWILKEYHRTTQQWMTTVIECFKVRWKRQLQAKLVMISVMLVCVPIWRIFGRNCGRHFLVSDFKLPTSAYVA